MTVRTVKWASPADFARALFLSELFLSPVGPPSQTPKEDGRGSGQAGEILSLKRPYDVMEGGRGPSLRGDSSVNCEGKSLQQTLL